MVKEIYHPNAYLSCVKNVVRGLKARTKILYALEKAIGDAKAVATRSGLTYRVAMHHLKLLAADGIVDYKDHRPCVWAITGKGQKRLITSD
jgi:DNA-binding transcriptional ArsR family regulator